MKNPRPKDETCATCVYYQSSNSPTVNGDCRCDPPLLFDDGETGWPHVRQNDWCGNYNDDWKNRYRKDSPEEVPHHGLGRTGIPSYGARGAD